MGIFFSARLDSEGTELPVDAIHENYELCLEVGGIRSDRYAYTATDPIQFAAWCRQLLILFDLLSSDRHLVR